MGNVDNRMLVKDKSELYVWLGGSEVYVQLEGVLLPDTC